LFVVLIALSSAAKVLRCFFLTLTIMKKKTVYALHDFHQYKKGDAITVDESTANALLAGNHAELRAEVEKKATQKRTTKKKTDASNKKDSHRH
jgi:hypothetical protein